MELDGKLGRERCQRAQASKTMPNYRNSCSKKAIKTPPDQVDIKFLRNRNNSFESKIIGKYSRNADGMKKILSPYARSMSQMDTAERINEPYNVDISAKPVSRASEKVMPKVTAWQKLSLERVYPSISIDCQPLRHDVSHTGSVPLSCLHRCIIRQICSSIIQ